MEFGSDYHLIDNLCQLSGTTSAENWHRRNLYANGRQAINALILHRGWSRIWIPLYFCNDIIDSIAKTGIEIAYYEDYPLADDSVAISQIRFTDTDVLLRMNYFGMRGWRDSSSLGVEVIEDHSHSLSGEWAQKSNAAWCIASLRKSMPISEGGALWSPKGRQLPPEPIQTQENIALSVRRHEAMRLKSRYIRGENIAKDDFRQLYTETESEFENLPLSAIESTDLQIVRSIDISQWDALKKRNWQLLTAQLSDKVEVLQPENEQCTPFSFVVRGQHLKEKLIEHEIYPAVLWRVPEVINKNLLSVHCDGRYSVDDIELMIQKIEECLK